MKNINSIDLFIAKMLKENIPSAAIDTFVHYYSKLKAGDTGLISENEIEPVSLHEFDDLASITTESKPEIVKLLAQVVCIKLNGGLGTTMGLQRPKSLIPVKNELSFLDITCRQLSVFNATYHVKIPLVLMNSFRTEMESISAISKYPNIRTDIPVSFIQNKFPKILASSLLPATYQEDPALEWNPPGHGDLYVAFQTSGILAQLISKGYKYAFISNSDNLGATLNPAILNYIAEKKIPFLMEVTDRTWMDRKGGHLARLKNGGHLILREAAQCPEKDIEAFRNISRYSYFNTNNLWLDLVALKQKLEYSNGFLNLPMIRNRKKLNPVVKDSPEIYQVESAMGTAISIFENASALRVPRNRFAPVKNCEDLLLLWSDAFILDDNCQIAVNPARKHANIDIQLDPDFFSFINQLYERFPKGAPSLLECKDLSIKGDFLFGKNIKLIGSVTLINPGPKQITIADNTVIDASSKYAQN
jgi:UTP--glucose-1-phosphate uridylyltransferase